MTRLQDETIGEIQDIELAFTKSEYMDNWWLIERAHHDGRTWMEKRDDYFTIMDSARISDADIEGGLGDMLGIAEAIENRSSDESRRCAVAYDKDNNCFQFWSPRNSLTRACVPVERADALAKQIREKAGEK